MQGTYTALIQGTDVSTGEWTMEITENEIMVTNPRPGSDSFPVGVTAITADHVNFYADDECSAPHDAIEGKYTYAFDGHELTFDLIEDSCSDRQVLLTTAPWVRKS